MELNAGNIRISDLNKITITTDSASVDCGYGALQIGGVIEIKQNGNAEQNAPVVQAKEFDLNEFLSVKEVSDIENQDKVNELETKLSQDAETHKEIVAQLQSDLKAAVDKSENIEKKFKMLFEQRVEAIKHKYEQKYKLYKENYEGVVKYGKAFRTAECHSVKNKSFTCNRKECRYYHSEEEKREYDGF